MTKVDSLIHRAHLFDHFIDDSNWAAYSELVTNKHYQREGSINLLIGAYYLDPPPPDLPDGSYINYKEVIQYCVLFGNQISIKENETTDEESDDWYITQPTIQTVYWNDMKKELAGYAEITPEFKTDMLFYKNTNPQECKIFYYKKFKGFDYDVITKINWDEDKKITSREKIELMQKLPPLVTKFSKPTIEERKLPTINLNTIKDQKILEVLRRTEKICSLKNIHEFITNAQSLPLFNKKDLLRLRYGL